MRERLRGGGVRRSPWLSYGPTNPARARFISCPTRDLSVTKPAMRILYRAPVRTRVNQGR